MLASFLITFREGLEAFLLVGIILAYLRKLGASRHNKWIYLGVFGGLLASLAVAVIFQVVIDQFQNQRYQTLLMVFVLLLASLVLSFMALWMQRQAKQHTANVKEQLEGYVNSGNLMGMVLLSFVAVLREGFETVLFFSALVYSGQGVDLNSGLTGALAGLAASLAIVAVLMRGTRRVPLQAFFRYTSLLVIVIAAGLLASAVNMMQSVDLLPMASGPLFDISNILDDQGLFGTFLRALFGYNSSPTPAQFGCWLVYLGIAVTLWHRGYTRAKA